MILLGVSILGIAGLFYVKHWEERNAQIFAPAFRLVADSKALDIKFFLGLTQQEFKKLGPTSVRVARALLHDLALSLAALSRASERGAHQLADMVSHKHRFERRETKNEFLKQVSDVPMRNTREATPPAATEQVPVDEVQIPTPVAPPVVAKEIPPAPPTVTPVKKGRNGKHSKKSLENKA